MGSKLLVVIIKAIKYPFVAFAYRTRFTRHFWFPNFTAILQQKVRYATKPACVQKVIISGEGKVNIGRNCSFGNKLGGFYRSACVELQARTPGSNIHIGDGIMVNNNLFICSSGKVEIGKNCRIGQYVIMMDFEAHGIHPAKRDIPGEAGNITIGDNVWIGNNVSILMNTVVGENSIIATGAVVKGVFPANVIIGGVPAKIIKTIPE